MNKNEVTRTHIFFKALSSRLFVALCMVLSHSAIPNFDPGHDVASFKFSAPIERRGAPRVLSAFTKWDAARFLNLALDPRIRSSKIIISEEGKRKLNDFGSPKIVQLMRQKICYSSSMLHVHAKCYLKVSKRRLQEAEESQAFFPLWPAVIRFFFSLVDNLVPMRVDTGMVLVALLMNALSFSAAAVCLDELSRDFLKFSDIFGGDQYFTYDEARTAVELYIWNPANVFFTTCYSEGIFSLFVFCGYMCHVKSRLVSGWYQIIGLKIVALLMFLLSAWTRSNGVFVLVYVLAMNVIALVHNVGKHGKMRNFIFYFAAFLASSLLVVVALVLPMWIHNFRGRALLCGGPIRNSYCKKADYMTELNDVYTYVQSKYWNVGMFKFYEWKQIPNFILATPVFVILFQGIYRHYQFLDRSSKGEYLTFVRACLNDPYICHLAVLVLSAATCLTMAHIHISTR